MNLKPAMQPPDFDKLCYYEGGVQGFLRRFSISCLFVFMQEKCARED
jgi:hypothetical protein